MADIIECEENFFSHYLNHFDECDSEHPDYNVELECIDVLASCSEEIIWE